MVPESFANFFLASAGAGGALIGLLFVAISVAPERTVTRQASMLRRATAGSAFSALINAFFISLGALLPKENLGYLILIFGILGILNNVQLTISLAQRWRDWKDGVRRAVLVLASIIIYGMEIYYGIKTIVAPHDVDLIYSSATLILVVYGLGLTRAWELLGAHRYGILGWLSPLHEEEEVGDKTVAP